MKIGIVTTDSALQNQLVAEVRAAGQQPLVSDDIWQALNRGCQLIFAEWGIGERLPALLAGLKAATAQAVPVVALVPHGAVVLMQRARAAGAADALFSPPDTLEIRAEIEDWTRTAQPAAFAYAERFRELRRQSLIGEDPQFLRCLEDLRRAAQSDANVLIIGETGTGKEMFAAAIHQLSPWSTQPYLPVNCAGFPGALLEAELFGHTKGAFTGADRERVGRFEEVKGGTLVLDEIGDIDLPFQTKLLRAIEQKVFQRLGENRDRKFNARLISATSVNLEKAVEAGKFRRDLLGRIDQFRIVLPPLRERPGDVSILTRYFMQKHLRGRSVELSKTVLEMLEAYDFPMNIRQLENAIIGALMRADNGRVILPKHLPREMVEAKPVAANVAERTLALPAAFSYKEAREYALRMVDQMFLTELLRQHGNNLSRVAEVAGIDRKTLRERLRLSANETGETTED